MGIHRTRVLSTQKTIGALERESHLVSTPIPRGVVVFASKSPTTTTTTRVLELPEEEEERELLTLASTKNRRGDAFFSFRITSQKKESRPAPCKVFSSLRFFSPRRGTESAKRSSSSSSSLAE